MKKTPIALFLAGGLILSGGLATAANLTQHTPNATFRVLADCGFDGEQQGESNIDKACNDADEPEDQTGTDEQGTTGDKDDQDKDDQTGDKNDQTGQQGENDGDNAD